jgi:hypothetical protein
MSNAGAHPANWYPDPAGRHELRYYDGTQWTEHVSSGGKQTIDPVGPAAAPVQAASAARVQAQVAKAGVQAGSAVGGGTIFTEPVLVVNQKVKVIELNNEYAIHDQHGRQLGAVRQVGQSSAKKAARMLLNVDQFMTHSLQIVDMTGAVHLTVTRPRKFVKSRFLVGDGSGREIGQIVQRNVFGKIQLRVRSRRSRGRRTQGRELAGVELQHPGRGRQRGRPHQEDVGGSGEDDVHHGRQLRRPDPAAARRTPAESRRGVGTVRRHRAQAGQPRPQLRRAVVADLSLSTAHVVREAVARHRRGPRRSAICPRLSCPRM